MTHGTLTIPVEVEFTTTRDVVQTPEGHMPVVAGVFLVTLPTGAKVVFNAEQAGEFLTGEGIADLLAKSIVPNAEGLPGIEETDDTVGHDAGQSSTAEDSEGVAAHDDGADITPDTITGSTAETTGFLESSEQ